MRGLAAAPLLRAWAWLMAVSAATTVLTLATDGAPLAPWSAAALGGALLLFLGLFLIPLAG